ncbi:hypothetical protein BFX86_20750 [Enterobacter hormaechei]|nr:hypothetical protein SS57_03510 [Enterobacter hormaechei subsp. xiangfangensis]KJM98708.1 hypothetical protein SS42_22875 [Enterobacter hormaechei subsp. xiangfangensis]PLV45792.1 hypothetical protein BFX86_20750 [Enterobacter hormaechei]
MVTEEAFNLKPLYDRTILVNDKEPYTFITKSALKLPFLLILLVKSIALSKVARGREVTRPVFWSFPEEGFTWISRL